ncbi:MAG: Rpn family recombination-promoting nuclease/putative transposase [Clostridia bacterium]|nr:Rpn family recombination-promoting nuclease/putative transposase [Clostridia bacterium]
MSRLKPTNDFLFKKLFGESKNENLLRDLLESILTDIKIEKIEINKDVSLERKMLTDKLGILDIVATLNDKTKVNIEMQVQDYLNTIERSLFYGTGVYHESLKAGENYIDIPKSISIWITNYNVFEDGPFHERAHLRRDYENSLLTDSLELHYIQLPKFKEKCKRISSKLEEWLTFIINENMEAIKMSENENIKKAEEEFEYLTGDEETKRLAYLREKAIRDEAAAIAGALKRGRAEGKTGTKLEIAKNMLAEKIDIETIIKVTGLTREEIEKL